MEKKNTKNKVIIALLIIILIAGAAIIAVKGFNFSLRYEKAQKIEMYLNKNFEISDIRNITNEVFGEQPVIIQKVEVYGDTVTITTTEISDEQKSNLITKINEKYGTELSAENTEISNVPHTRGRDIVKPYIIPFVIATIISLIYIAIKYHKIGSIKAALKSLVIILLAQAELFAIIALTRIPIGRLTIPMVIVVYLLTMVGITSNFEKQIEKVKEDDKKEK